LPTPRRSTVHWSFLKAPISAGAKHGDACAARIIPISAKPLRRLPHSYFVMRLSILFILLLSLPAVVHGEEISVKGGMIDLHLGPEPSAALRPVAMQWIQTAANNVAAYYGSFSVPRATLRIKLVAGHEPKGGTAYGWKGPLITISLGKDSTSNDLSNDWQLTHEMLHLAFPSVPDDNHWLEEGLATYVESIARARAGQLTPERAWSDLVNGLAQGQPGPGDRGLDHTHTWGRTYWGGAIFCLRADVEIRRRTQNHKGLEHALRAIRSEGGVITEDWTMDRVISVGDKATGVPVLRELYDQMKGTPVTTDLEGLYRQLGIHRNGREVILDDVAPLAEIRKAITRPN